MDLGVARVGEQGAAAVGPPGGRRVAVDRIGRQVEDRAVSAGGQDHGVGLVALDLAGHQFAGDDAAGLAIDDHQVQHLVAREHGHRAGGDLAAQGTVDAQQELLAGLAAGVEGAADLHAAERPVGQGAAVLAGERHAHGDALVDDAGRELGQTVDVGLPGPIIAALDGVVEQAIDAVAVVLVVLRRVDAALGRHAVGPARRVLDAEVQHVVAQLAEGGRGAAAGQTRSHDDDLELASVAAGGDQRIVDHVLVPLVGQRAAGDLGVEYSLISH